MGGIRKIQYLTNTDHNEEKTIKNNHYLVFKCRQMEAKPESHLQFY